MTHNKIFKIALTVMYVLFSIAAKADIGNDHNESNSTTQTEKHANNDQGKQSPAAQDEHSKLPHGKTHAPHSEELPHIHKFHKERVKKLKKHHGKYWLLSQVLLFLCHVAILYIIYLHTAH